MNPRTHPDAEINSNQLQELLSRLLKQREQLANEIETLNQQITRKEDCSLADAAEAASLKEEAARATGIAAQHRQTMLEIDHALMRMESGRYGVCEDSGEPIPYARLLLVPWAKSGVG
jgi:DnaK suppressor protein